MKERVLISMIFNNVGFSNAKLKREKKALYYYMRSLRIKKDIGDVFGVGITLNNIGNIYRRKNDVKNARVYLEYSYGITQKIGDIQGEVIALENLSSLYKSMGDNDKAINYITRALRKAEENSLTYEIGDIKAILDSLNE